MPAGFESSALPSLTAEERSRYARHLTLGEVGEAGQRRLKASSCLVVGAGGLGSPALMYLAAAGVGRIGIVDFDRVDASNLHRQVLHATGAVGMPKTQSASNAIRAINPHVAIETYDEALSSGNALGIVEDFDIVLDGTDNFATRYLVNDVCVLTGTPNAYGSIFQFEGQASVFGVPDGPCYRCLYPQPPPPGAVPSCAEGGVLGVLPGVIGVIQATEAIKWMLGRGDTLAGRLLLYDALAMTFRELKISRDADCPVCGDQPTITAPIDYHEFCGAPNLSETSEPQCAWDVDPEEAKRQLEAGEAHLIDVREPNEYEFCNLDGQLIPLGELPARASELDREAKMIVHCKSGGRSSRAVEMLREAGFTDVWNLRGGILAWSDKIDSSIPKY